MNRRVACFSPDAVAGLMLVLWCGVFAYAQTPDLDLVTERSLGVSVSALVKVWCGISDFGLAGSCRAF